MESLRTDALRVYARHRERSRRNPARVLLPVALAGSAQLVLVIGCLALGLPAGTILIFVALLAVASAIIHRRTVGSLVAGAGIRVAQPYLPGDQIELVIPSRGRIEVAEVVRVGPANTTLMTDDGLVLVPNSVMIGR